MRPTAVRAALARLGASLLLALALVLPAAAADRALINMIGYSEDGRYFAFEQFGIQDGSGFAYSEVVVVDLVDDKWAAGSPFKVQAESEETALAEVRLEALGKAQPAFEEHRIGVPVEILSLIGDGEGNNNGKQINWSTPACCGAGHTEPDVQSLALVNYGAQRSDGYCQDMDVVGFVLSYQDADGKRELHADGPELPKSRGCTLDYRLYAVVTPYSFYYVDGFVARRVAIVATYPFGFEGVDRRFMAVPIDR